MIINGKEYEVELNGETFHCALDFTMHYIGGKWKCIVLWYLKGRTMRFGELRRQMPSITEKMLTLQLRELEKDGFIGRKIYPEVPPRVEYFLTPKGETLIPMLDAMSLWGRGQLRKGQMVEIETNGKSKVRKPVAKGVKLF
jgi:DNA-binding HxlR family transcriptional regulator